MQLYKRESVRLTVVLSVTLLIGGHRLDGEQRLPCIGTCFMNGFFIFCPVKSTGAGSTNKCVKTTKKKEANLIAALAWIHEYEFVTANETSQHRQEVL